MYQHRLRTDGQQPRPSSELNILSVNEKLQVSPIHLTQHCVYFNAQFYGKEYHASPNENDINHIQMHYTHSLTDPSSSHCIV